MGAHRAYVFLLFNLATCCDSRAVTFYLGVTRPTLLKPGAAPVISYLFAFWWLESVGWSHHQNRENPRFHRFARRRRHNRSR